MLWSAKARNEYKVEFEVLPPNDGRSPYVVASIFLDSDAEKTEHIRVIDESGEDYLYPASCFIDANLSKETQD